MGPTKKQICIALACVVSLCFLVCLIALVRTAVLAVRAGASIPGGMVMLTLVTGVCAGMILRGVTKM